MNMKFWGGWFLAIAGISILLTMGCEKGALGVKPALVTGKIVDADSGNGIANATVRMISKEKFGTGLVQQGNNFATAVTNSTGNFIFENVVPDNVIFEYYANNYNQAIFPVKKAAADDQGNLDQTGNIEAVYIRSGAVMDVGDLKLSSMATSPLAATVRVKLDLRDNVSKEEISDAVAFEISLNGEVVSGLNASSWRNDGREIPSARSLKVVIRDVSTNMLYLAKTSDITVSGDVVEIIELDPVTYNIHMRAINVPDYISGGVVNVYAERPTTGGMPPKVLARQSIDNLGNLSGPNLPVLIQVPGLQEPVDLRIQVRGYEDEILKIDPANLPAGSQGNYRIDVDFTADNAATTVFYDPDNAANSTACLFDNMKRRNVALVVSGEDLTANNRVIAYINLPNNGNSSPYDTVINGESARIDFTGVAVGYDLYYTVNVSGSASGSYNLNNADGIMISPDIEPGMTTLIVGVNAKRPAS